MQVERPPSREPAVLLDAEEVLRNLGYYLRNRSPGDFIANRFVQWREPEVKIFFIGFNKSATSAIFHFLARQGVKSFHWQRGEENLAAEVEKRAGRPAELKRYLARATAFSDFTYSSDERVIDGNRHFRLFHELFPTAYFVLNDRDPERWVDSRLRHRRGEFARRSMKLRGCSEEELRAAWLKEREAHNRAVLVYFADHRRFLHFRVDRDPIARLIEFLSPHFRLKPHHWARENVSARRWPKP